MKRRIVRESEKFSRINFEKLEDRNMLSASPGTDLGGFLAQAQQQIILNHLAGQTETAYLQQGTNDLQLVGVENGNSTTTAVFQQLMDGLAIHGTYVSVVQGSNGEILDVHDQGVMFLATQDSLTPGFDLGNAQQIANGSFAGHNGLTTTGEMVWFHTNNRAELAWQVETIVAGANVLNSDLEFMTVVDANSGAVLSQVQSPSVIENLILQAEAGLYPRIVINDAIGPAGSQAYADPFDSVVALPGCTGTLVAANVVITARHCGSSAGDNVRFGDDSNNSTFSATVESSLLPAGNGSLLDGGDVAILTLTADVPANVATPMRFVDATDDLEGQLAATIGYGLNGVGSTGHGGSSDGIRWGGENIIEAYGTPASAAGANIISTDFDDGTAGSNTIPSSSPIPLEFEATTAPGDSGGPILVMAGGEWAISGVLSGGTSPTSVYGDISWWTGTTIYRTEIEAAGGEFVSFGEIEVSFNGVVIDDGSSFDFGVTALGQMITRTFTVRNVDNSSDLTLTEPINVPDEFTVIGSFGQTVLGPGQSTTFDVRFDSNPIGTYVGELSFESGDSDENPFNFSITAVVAPPIGEAGTVIADGGWTTVFLQNTYIDPVVVAGPATFNDADQLAVRVRNVTTDSFQIRAHEWSYLTGKHFNESIGYVVMESGVHRLSDGTTIIAQNTSGISTSFTSIPFELEFESTPIVLAQTVTVNGGAPVTTRLDEINPLNFQIKLQEEEAADQTHNPETIAWLAFLPSQENLGVLRQDADVTGFVVDENVETIPFSTNFAEAPVFIAGMQSFVGSNNATVRLADINANSASVFIEEEQSRDEEVGHGNENVGFMALQAGDIVGRTIIGEAGHIADLDRSWQTVNLAQDYLDPVIVFSTNSMNEADPGVIRVRNVTSNSFEVHFEEWNYLDLNHAPELVSFIVFESGIHRLRDGTIIEARNSLVDSEWADVAFTNDNGGVAPLVFSQIISENGPATATTRQQTITPDGFQIRLQEEEAATIQNHSQESVSWIAVQEIRGDVGGVFYEALMHDDGVNHVVATTVPLTNTFDESPAIITAQQTTIGDNTATVRGTFISAGRIDLFVEEERSFDNEVGHVREDVAVFALSLGIVDGFIIDLFDDGSLFTPNRSLGLARSSASFDNAGNVENIGNDVIQQMLLARQDFDTLGDSAFEQLGQSTLIHVDIDEATTVRAGAVLLDDQNSNRDFDIRDQHDSDKSEQTMQSEDLLGDLTRGF